jgi:hypothetical protein
MGGDLTKLSQPTILPANGSCHRLRSGNQQLIRLELETAKP